MSDAESGGALICGFSDLASGLGAVAWRFGEGGGLILGGDGVQEAEIDISGGDTVELRLSSSAGETEAKLTPRTGRLALAGVGESSPPGGPLEGAVCAAEVKPTGQSRTLRCFGHLSIWPDDPSAGASAFRHLAVERSDGSLLLMVARGEGGAGHGTEQTAAWVLDGEGGISAFGEALLSTQYDKDGRATRAGLELWPGGDEAPPMRAAGTSLGGSERGGLSAALLRCSTEGSEGLGSYLIKRA